MLTACDSTTSRPRHGALELSSEASTGFSTSTGEESAARLMIDVNVPHRGAIWKNLSTVVVWFWSPKGFRHSQRSPATQRGHAAVFWRKGTHVNTVFCYSCCILVIINGLFVVEGRLEVLVLFRSRKVICLRSGRFVWRERFAPTLI